jgi:hypothetical protein
MHTLRFGRKLNLPWTIAIKHQIRMLMAQYELKEGEAEARPEVAGCASTLCSIPAEVQRDALKDVTKGDSRG